MLLEALVYPIGENFRAPLSACLGIEVFLIKVTPVWILDASMISSLSVTEKYLYFFSCADILSMGVGGYQGVLSVSILAAS